MEATGFEPVTKPLGVASSSQLSYAPIRTSCPVIAGQDVILSKSDAFVEICIANFVKSLYTSSSRSIGRLSTAAVS